MSKMAIFGNHFHLGLRHRDRPNRTIKIHRPNRTVFQSILVKIKFKIWCQIIRPNRTIKLNHCPNRTVKLNHRPNRTMKIDHRPNRTRINQTTTLSIMTERMNRLSNIEVSRMTMIMNKVKIFHQTSETWSMLRITIQSPCLNLDHKIMDLSSCLDPRLRSRILERLMIHWSRKGSKSTVMNISISRGATRSLREGTMT